MKNFKWTSLILAIAVLPLMGFPSVQPETDGIVDIFSGTIDNSKLQNSVFLGYIVYDRNCKSIENGLTRCDTGVKTEDNGVINFNYTHKMSEQACLLGGDKVLLKVKKGRNAYIIR